MGEKIKLCDQNNLEANEARAIVAMIREPY